MAADYVLTFPCEVRKHVPEAKLVTLVGHMSLAQFAVAEIRRSEPDLPIETILDKVEVQVSQTRPDGTTTQVPMTIGQLAALAQPLGEYRGHCTDCRANIADRAFGCIAKINYPIRKESEEWLLSRLPADANDPNLSLLMRFLGGLKIDGRAVDTMRARLCELPQPVAREWSTPTGRARINSSQILQVLLFAGNISPQQATACTQMLGLETVLSDPHPPSGNIEQFKTLMCAIVMAGRLNAPIAMDA